ncbi:MAG: MerR family transcriptional regulator [Oscillospiraceae bacterium]|nr:MerR family transcriptional regulator [Oscillospiraceae bacterium]
MEKHRAIPAGYMTVGEIAKKMNVTVRTLQYYDKEGVLSPSAESEGGRRLYTQKDIVKLHQIQSMKYLGFSLEDIKTRIPSIETPEEVSALLAEQAKGIREKIKSLKDVLVSIEKLNAEVSQMKTVAWDKYANIIVLLQAKNDSYWVVKHFDDKMSDHFYSFDEERAYALMNAQQNMYKKIDVFQKKGILPKSEQGQAFAKEFWDVTMEITNGDKEMLFKLIEIADKEKNSEWKSREDFIGDALTAYFEKQGINPFEE